jgi:hypothetical protein
LIEGRTLVEQLDFQTFVFYPVYHACDSLARHVNAFVRAASIGMTHHISDRFVHRTRYGTAFRR